MNVIVKNRHDKRSPFSFSFILQAKKLTNKIQWIFSFFLQKMFFKNIAGMLKDICYKKLKEVTNIFHSSWKKI